MKQFRFKFLNFSQSQDASDLYLLPIFNSWDDLLQGGFKSATLLAFKSAVAGARRISSLPEGIDFSCLMPTTFMIERERKGELFILFLGPQSRFSMVDLLAMIRFTFRAGGEIFKEDTLQLFQTELDLSRFKTFGLSVDSNAQRLNSAENIQVNAQRTFFDYFYLL